MSELALGWSTDFLCCREESILQIRQLAEEVLDAASSAAAVFDAASDAAAAAASAAAVNLNP